MQQYTEVGKGFKSVINEYDDEVHIAMIVVDDECRNQGIGTKYVVDMISYAKRYNKKISLIPSDILGGNLRKLKKFYGRLGFKQIGKKWYYFD